MSKSPSTRTVPPARDLKKEVADWLATHGFRVEFAAARSFAKERYEASLGQYLPGLDGTLREVDVLATRCIPVASRGELSKQGKLQVAFVVECKYSGANPWVLLGAEQVREPNGVPPYVPRDMDLAAGQKPLAAKRGKTNSGDRLKVSHGIIQSKLSTNDGKKDRDAAFAACKKVAEQAWVFARDRRHAAQGVPPEARIAIPCVVVDGQLFRARPGEDRQLEVEASDFGHLVLNAIPDPTRVDIITLSALDKYLRWMSPRLRHWAAFAAGQRYSDKLIPLRATTGLALK